MVVLNFESGISLFSFPVLLGFAVALYIVHCCIQYAFLRQFKGPFSVGFSKLWLLRTMRSGNMHLTFTDVNREYGSFARIGPQQLLVSDVEFIRKINAARGSTYSRSDWYKGGRFVPNEDTVLSATSESEHKSLRQKMAPAYNMHAENSRAEDSIDSQLTIMLDLIKSKYTSSPGSRTKPLDYGLLANYYTIDSICDIAFSEPLGDLNVNQDKFDFIHNMEGGLSVMSIFTCYTWMLRLLQAGPIARFCAPNPGDLSPFGHVMGFARRHARRRFGADKIEREDMLQSFLKHGMTPGEAERASVLQLVAGSDTVATAIRAAVLFIATSPPVLARLRADLAAAGITADRSTSSITSSAQARSVAYLVAVVKEALRMHPPVVGGLEKQAGPGGDVLPDGRAIPPGTKIQVSTWATQRDPATFGDDADCFRPERWLEVEEGSERKKRMDRAQELVFGAGRFICIGKDIAIAQCLKVIPELFSRFDITVINPERPWYSAGYGIFCQHDMWVRVTDRNLKLEQTERVVT